MSPWAGCRDGIEDVEAKTIEGLSYMANKDAEVASSVVSLGWVQDGIDDVEAEAIRWMNNIGSTGGCIVRSFVGWVQDGVDAVEIKAIENLSYIANRYADVASSIVSLNWVHDGVDAVEVKAIESLFFIANEDPEVATSIVYLRWVQDGIEDAEVGLIGNFVWISKRDPGAALQIAGMPFVETIEPPDISAIEALSRLATFAPETFVRVMSHTALLDGISDDLAPVVATLHGVARTNPGLIDVLPRPNQNLPGAARHHTAAVGRRHPCYHPHRSRRAEVDGPAGAFRAERRRVHGRAAAYQLRRPAL